MLVLTRTISNTHGTFGKLELPLGKTLYTCERPWNDNCRWTAAAPDQASCVPTGTYQLVPHHSKKSHIGDTVALISDLYNITHYEESDSERFCILIHVGNKPEDVQGCIAIGMGLSEANGQFGVYKSRIAHNYFKKYIQDNEPDLLKIQEMIK